MIVIQMLTNKYSRVRNALNNYARSIQKTAEVLLKEVKSLKNHWHEEWWIVLIPGADRQSRFGKLPLHQLYSISGEEED